MADSAFQTQYRQEFIAGFEQSQALLRNTVTTEAMVKGNSAVFLVADSGSANAVTRGLNGLIPGRADNLAQNTVTLQEWHDKPIRTGFNIFASQGDGRRIMQQTSMAVINRKIDSDIIGALSTATQNTGAAATGSLALVMRAVAILGNNAATGGSLFGAITPAMYAYLMQQNSFASADFVNSKPLVGDALATFKWAGVEWVVHPNLPGKGTNAEKCFVYNKAAIGHAIATDSLQTAVGYDEEDDYSFVRTSVYMGSSLLQNSGVVVINHDGSAMA